MFNYSQYSFTISSGSAPIFSFASYMIRVLFLYSSFAYTIIAAPSVVFFVASRSNFSSPTNFLQTLLDIHVIRLLIRSFRKIRLPFLEVI